MSITNVEILLNVIAELFGGLWFTGNASAMNYFKAYGYVTTSQTLHFAQDLKLAHPIFKTKQGHRGDATLVPLSIPPLRGRLTLTTITEKNFVMDMITLLGGLRFSYVELFAVMGTRQVLRTCGNTLDTLRLYPKDPVGTVFPFLLSG